MSNQYEIRLSGAGGQGLILAGIILAEAAIKDGKNAVQTQSYGPEARGGASKSEVIISNKEINYPKVRKCDLLLALTQKACDEYIDSLKKDGILIVDNSVEVKRKDIKKFKLPVIETANEKLKVPMVANIVALGAICKASSIVTKDSLENAILNRVPRGTEDINKTAFEKGLNLINN
ncbi:2-oxoacid:acceptor oxidoreductase family protein [Thermohalobacter berrensis]|uniref:2-oxoglutarate ferredoxin oxidoreductase subunit gamma n=1 Tax=Thermohalobacter berrensis TaxID=99594 RepID=A0A419TAL8_9FIRM|nr:2-oxoacid:acceptor oxidoreductase family protein [Thermohalobacter berrensis]RKD34528.1 2-oxoglutarate ferredoxin oxidoreductase subunit gamma [Thermohalobacter berrensis]